jgi:hypothetical protein
LPRELAARKCCLYNPLMTDTLRYLREFFRDVHWGVLAATSTLTGLLIVLNYGWGLDRWISFQYSQHTWFLSRFALFFFTMVVPYGFVALFARRSYFHLPLFWFLIIVSPAMFSAKMAVLTNWNLHPDPFRDEYWNAVVSWPSRLLPMILALGIIWLAFYRDESFFGFTFTGFRWKTYALMLLFMIPLIVGASTLPDFLRTYPRVQTVSHLLSEGFHRYLDILWYELAYGSNFISIELFFRGYLVLAFARFAGKDAILPMACFYCAIHFGKPLGECISSYFGGMLLGIMVYNTRSIVGGLMVHLGIAWLMELGGYLGNSLFR